MPARLDAIEETMLIPLWARARETRRPDALVEDADAERVAAGIPYDFTRFERAWKTQVGVAVRTRYLDAAARAFIVRYPDAVIVNIGAGLDTRFRRIDNGRITWFDLDTPEATAFRRRHLPDRPPRHRTLATSVFDGRWIDEVRGSSPRPTLLIAEGVLMFLERDAVLALIDRLARTFPSGEILFDCIGRWMVHMPWLHDTLPATRAEFAWGVGSRDEPATWSARCRLLASRSMLDEAPDRWRWMRWLRFLPGFREQFVVCHLMFV